ncbi:FGGY-family carbohydrate kinase [uncultured Eubacterium sp.]|uniref:xylulokinase n=1 Tax=uncultured Eubacterium sp. TaxID=165185 RepID=UPI0025E0F6FD|nr:FGGY-family carbohydrate kinase [uncultured Eubacterium sp.]
MDNMKIAERIRNGQTVLGMEFGSTRIKAILIDEAGNPLASGSHGWENRLENQIWTYSLTDIREGLQDCYADLKQDVQKKYGETLTKVAALGFSGMMHGYMAFDAEDQLLVPFRTWRNTMTEQAAKELSETFSFNIPQRWSVAHLYQAILNGESHVNQISFVTTLAGYIHWKLTGEKVVGVGEAAGMFPIDSNTNVYDEVMAAKFDGLLQAKGMKYHLKDIFPKVLVAGEQAGTLTEAGAKLLDPAGDLQAGIPLCPPEGDAGTGMTATNSVAVRTGNVSAGTSVFAMVVMEHALSKYYEEIDMVTTPDGKPVAMVHCNNCTSDLNAWVGLFGEALETFGVKPDMDTLYGTLYRKALEGDTDCGGLLAYNYFSGESITGFEKGRPLFVRRPDSAFNLANFMRVHLMTSLGALKAGMDILVKQEKVQIDKMLGHGGFFLTKGVGQRIMAAAMQTPVFVMETAGEGGAWGIALLAAYMQNKSEGETLPEYLNTRIFHGEEGSAMQPEAADVEGFEAFMKDYKAGLAIERAAVEQLH